MDEKEKLIKVNAFLAKEQINELKKYGEMADGSLSWCIRAAVRFFIKNKVKRE